MYCPKCGGSGSDDQQFCRYCGLSLEMHGQILAYQRLLDESDEAPVTNEQHAQSHRHRTLFRISVALAIAGALLLFIVGKENFYSWVGSIALLTTGIAMIVLCIEVPFLFYRRKFPKVRNDRPSFQLTVPKETPTTSRVEGEAQGLASVTESTTGLLEASNAEARTTDGLQSPRDYY